MFGFIEKFKRHCAKGAYLKAIEHAKELRTEEYKEIKRLSPKWLPMPEIYRNRLEANNRLVYRLTKKMNEKFPDKPETRWHKKLK